MDMQVIIQFAHLPMLHFVRNHLKSRKSLDFEWSGFGMVKAIAILKAKA